MTTVASSVHKRPRKLWWLVGVALFFVSVIVQMPAAWLVQKYAPNSPYLQHVSGNLWQGAAIWRVPQRSQALTGSVNWTWQPWQLFLGRLGAEVTLSSGQSQMQGDVYLKRNGWAVNNMSGKVTPDTLAHLMDWQLPETPIQLNAVTLERDKRKGFIDADGQLTWVGGELGYPSGGKVYRIKLPAMYANLSVEQKGEQSLLHASLLDNKDKRLGDLYLDPEQMLDVNLTQRLLENMSDYKGQAPLDTPVVSVRQPLLSGMMPAQGGR